jgi:hypothetical protein
MTLVAWRLWECATTEDGAFVLQPLVWEFSPDWEAWARRRCSDQQLWWDGKHSFWDAPVETAICLAIPWHRPPVRGCQCGVWALFGPPRWRYDEEYKCFTTDGGWVGPIAGLIRPRPPVVVGTAGLRCASAVVERLLVHGGAVWSDGADAAQVAQALARRYECEADVVSSAEQLAATVASWHPLVRATRRYLRREAQLHGQLAGRIITQHDWSEEIGHDTR